MVTKKKLNYINCNDIPLNLTKLSFISCNHLNIYNFAFIKLPIEK